MRATLWVMIEAVVFTLGVGTGILVQRNFAADPSDWLGFAGALIGAGVTVLGALVAVELQKSAEERAMSRLLSDQISDILRWSQKVRKFDAESGSDENVLRAANAEHLAAAIDRLKQSRQWVTPTSAKMVHAMALLDDLPREVQVWFGTKTKPTYVRYEKVDEELKSLETSLKLAERLLGI